MVINVIIIWMKFFLMRHGITEYNMHGQMQGSLSNIQLATEGIKQAQKVKEMVNGLNINHVYSGELDRQIETAKIATSDLKNVDYHTLSNFNEISFGEFEGMSWSEAFSIANQKASTNLKGFRVDNPIEIGDAFKIADTSGKAENSKEVADRFLKGIQILENYYNDDSNILIVSSGMAIGTFFYIHCCRLSEFSMNNCGIYSVEKKDNQYFGRCIFTGFDS